MALDIQTAYQWMLRICAVGLVIDSLEQLARRRELEDGFYAWKILRLRLDTAPPLVRHVADALFQGSARPVAFLVSRLAAVAIAVAWPVGSTPSRVALLILVLAQLYLFLRRCGLGIGGADNMNLIVLGTAWLCTAVAHDKASMTAGLVFITAVTCLAYFAYGITKLASQTWRSGRALPAAVASYSYGHRVFYRPLASRPALGFLLCWLTIGWECLFPLVLVVPPPIRLFLLLSGAFFHFSIAVAMGIDDLLWAYAATYPAIWWVAAG